MARPRKNPVSETSGSESSESKFRPVLSVASFEATVSREGGTSDSLSFARQDGSIVVERSGDTESRRSYSIPAGYEADKDMAQIVAKKLHNDFQISVSDSRKVTQLLLGL